MLRGRPLFRKVFRVQPFFSMSGASLGALPPAGWASSEGGDIQNGETRYKGEEDDEESETEGEYADFKHSQSLEEALSFIIQQP